MQRRPFPGSRQAPLPTPGNIPCLPGLVRWVDVWGGRSDRRPGPQPSGALKVASSTGRQAGTQGGSFKRGDTRSGLDLHKTMFKPAFPSVVLPISQYASR